MEDYAGQKLSRASSPDRHDLPLRLAPTFPSSLPLRHEIVNSFTFVLSLLFSCLASSAFLSLPAEQAFHSFVQNCQLRFASFQYELLLPSLRTTCTHTPWLLFSLRSLHTLRWQLQAQPPTARHRGPWTSLTTRQLPRPSRGTTPPRGPSRTFRSRQVSKFFNAVHLKVPGANRGSRPPTAAVSSSTSSRVTSART